MARTESLELLSSVIDELETIGQMTAGNPLRAAHWNVMVNAVKNMARLIVSREKTTDAWLDEHYATRDHTHMGKMELTWFEPGARTLLEEAMSGAVEQRAAVKELRREMSAIREDMNQLKSQVDNIRVMFDGLRDEDAARRREVSNLAIRIEGVADVEQNLASLNERFDNIGVALDDALAFRAQLVDADGNPIDVAGMQNRVNDLEGMRQNLITADGNIVNIREFEADLVRLQENAINRNDVDDVILQRLREGDILDEAGLINTVTTQVQAGFTTQFDTLTNTTNELATRIDTTNNTIAVQNTRLDNVESGVTSALSSLGALSGLPAQVSSQGTRLTNLEVHVQANEAAITDLPSIRQRLATAENKITAIDTLNDEVIGLGNRLETAENNITQIDVLSSRINTVSARITSIEQKLPNMAQLQQQVASNTNTMEILSQRVTTNEAELDNLAGLTDQVESLNKVTQEITEWRIVVDQRLYEFSLQPSINGTLVDRVGSLESTLADNTTVVRRLDQSVSNIESVMPTLQALPEQLTGLNTRIKTLESGRIPIRSSDILVSNVDRLESTLADNTTVVRRLDQSVSNIESVMPTLQALPEQLTGLNTRLKTLETSEILKKTEKTDKKSPPSSSSRTLKKRKKTDKKGPSSSKG